MPNIIINDILAAISHYLLPAIIIGLIAAVTCLLFYRLVSPNIYHQMLHCYLDKLILSYFLYIYCFMVVAITLISREPGSRKSIDLELFSTFSHIFEQNIYPLENIILFIPLGILLPFLWSRFHHVIWCMGAGLILSFGIELTQYLTERGFSQIDDILTNVFGTLVGFGVYCLIIRIIRTLTSKYL